MSFQGNRCQRFPFSIRPFGLRLSVHSRREASAEPSKVDSDVRRISLHPFPTTYSALPSTPASTNRSVADRLRRTAAFGHDVLDVDVVRIAFFQHGENKFSN